MKQFEKWFGEENKDCEIEDNICDKVGNCDACKSLQKIGWRAALLWYYKTAEHLSPSDCDLIDEELEDETS